MGFSLALALTFALVGPRGGGGGARVRVRLGSAAARAATTRSLSRWTRGLTTTPATTTTATTTRTRKGTRTRMAALVSATAATMTLAAFITLSASAATTTEAATTKYPKFTREQVAKHNTKDSVWVTFRDGVYDVTDFVEGHPGGDRLLLAAGGAVEPFWKLYPQHLTAQVQEILQEFKIGELEGGGGGVDATATAAEEDDPYATEPTTRSPALTIYSLKPFNAGTVESVLGDSFLTPTDLFYVRHHHPVPTVSDEDYRLTIGSKTLSLNELRTRYPTKEIAATLVCAGNRRREFNAPQMGGETQGIPWASDAVSTAKWRGVPLSFFKRELLSDFPMAQHVCFEAYDAPFDASVPVTKGLNEEGDVILAFEMNGAPIPRDHGGPVRVVVPGHVAVRSVKWLKRVYVSTEESESPWQRGAAYKSFGPMIKSLDKTFDAEKYPSVQELPVQSAVTFVGWESPARQSLEARGWAWSGGGRRIVRVEVSPDGGQTWVEAEMGPGHDQPSGRAWAWTLWRAKGVVPPSQGPREFCVRAVDESFQVQPETPRAVWNLRGIINHSVHRVEYS